MNKKQKEKLEAIETLKNMIPLGSKVYTALNHVSRSGMTREISVHIIQDNKPINITWKVGKTLGLKEGKTRGLRMGGYGTDMGFEIVYNLGYVLYKDNFICVGENCPSNDHSNGDRDYIPHPHNDSGYAFRHEWL